MGFFKKMSDQAKDAANAAAAAAGGQGGGFDQGAAQQAMAQQRAMGIDTASFGGPSNAPVADDDPIWQPIEGISLEVYAVTAKKASNLGVTDEAGMAEVASQEGLDPTAFAAAAQGWVARMGQSMAVGQRFRTYYDPA
jgi:hypothetical protein